MIWCTNKMRNDWQKIKESLEFLKRVFDRGNNWLTGFENFYNSVYRYVTMSVCLSDTKTGNSTMRVQHEHILAEWQVEFFNIGNNLHLSLFQIVTIPSSIFESAISALKTGHMTILLRSVPRQECRVVPRQECTSVLYEHILYSDLCPDKSAA